MIQHSDHTPPSIRLLSATVCPRDTQKLGITSCACHILRYPTAASTSFASKIGIEQAVRSMVAVNLAAIAGLIIHVYPLPQYNISTIL